MIEALEKLKYLRSRPSCAWQSAQWARIGGAFGKCLPLEGQLAKGPARRESTPHRAAAASRCGVFLRECVRRQHRAGIDGKEIERQDPKPARHSIGKVEAEPNRVGARNHRVRGKRQGDLECREPTADSAVALARLLDRNRVVVQTEARRWR